MKMTPYYISLILFLNSCSQSSPMSDTWIDLTHPFDSNTLYWPNNKVGFVHTTDYKGIVRPMGYFYSSYSISTPEHGGTHLDAPIHFAENKKTADQVPLSQLTGKAIVIDVSAKALSNSDYQIQPEDIEDWESKNGKIEDGTIVLFRTGYAQFYPDRKKYFGTDQKGEEALSNLHFPGIHPEAAKWLVDNRKISSVGLDTPSMDYGQSREFKTHQIFLGQNIPGFENVNIPMNLPEKGLYLIALPMKIGNGSGAPLRIIVNVLS
ncbi:MAG: cyclase family protein [Flavobacteriales bacterium]